MSLGCNRRRRKSPLHVHVAAEGIDLLLMWSWRTIRFAESTDEAQPVARRLPKLLVGLFRPPTAGISIPTVSPSFRGALDIFPLNRSGLVQFHQGCGAIDSYS